MLTEKTSRAFKQAFTFLARATAIFPYLPSESFETTFMKILWFTWKDLKNPLSGGAERINEEIAKRLVRDGHDVVLLTAGFPGGASEETQDGYRIIRVGNRYTVYGCAWRYYRRFLKGWADLVVDEMNTVPFFCKYFVRERNVLLSYQLCREIWFHQMPFPLSVVGYLLEPVYLWMLNDRQVITESRSTKQDFQRYGFDPGKVHVISVGNPVPPLEDIQSAVKCSTPTVLSLGSIRGMKQTVYQLKAFEIAKRRMPALRFKVAGTAVGSYGKKFMRLLKKSPFARDIDYEGVVSEERKMELMRESHIILVTSVKEGWGLIATEANGQGTPAVVYDVDGLRDSVRHGQTGLVCRENSPQCLAETVVGLLSDRAAYDRLRTQAWQWSRELTFDRCYGDFKGAVEAL